jgi:uncharacterized protein (DUF885 family)
MMRRERSYVGPDGAPILADALRVGQGKKKEGVAMRVNRFKGIMPAFLAVVLTITCAAGPMTLTAAGQMQTKVKAPNIFPNLRESLTNRIYLHEPEEYRMLGGPVESFRLKDWSPGAIKAEVDFCRDGLRRLAATQTSTSAEALDKEVLTAHLTYLEYYYGQYHGELGNLRISEYPYDVIQYELQRFSTGRRDAASAGKHFRAVRAVLRDLPKHLRQQQSNLTAGLELRKPDREILSTLIDSIGTPANPNSIRGWLKGFAAYLESSELKSLLTTSEREELRSLIQPADAAYAAHAAFLNDRLLPQARDSWPLGRSEYERRFTMIYGDRVSLDELVREAEAELRRINDEMNSLANELRPGVPLGEVLDQLEKQDTASGRELISAYERTQKRIDDGITRGLGLPVGAAKYIPAPPGVRVDSATNWPAPLLSKGAGIVLVNTSPSGLVNIPWITIHEGGPGHAAQSVLFQTAFNEGRAPLCRFFNVPDEVGYVRGNWYAMANIEGWAFYTERLLLKSGLLTREERLAALSGQALRAARVVVDVRMHTAGWSREDVAKYLNQYAGLSQEAAQKQAYRYSRIPLQALSYYFGARQFEELQRKYGARFGGDFYRKILSLGPVPPRFIGDYLESSETSNRYRE